jgi:hypothetical protein
VSIVGVILAAAVMVAPTEVWIMGVQICRGPPGYIEAVEKGLIPGVRLDCRWFTYANQEGVEPRFFDSEKACLDHVIVEDPNGLYSLRQRSCQRIE